MSNDFDSLYGSKYLARLAHGLRCSHCQRPLQAIDVRVDDADRRVEIICGGCHRSLLKIEDRSGPAPAIWG